MNKLTAEVARRDIGHLKSYPSRSLREELYLQSLEIALPVLEGRIATSSIPKELFDRLYDQYLMGVICGKENKSAVKDFLNACVIALYDSPPVPAQQEKACQKCDGSGAMDSGTQMWGDTVYVDCDCVVEQQEKGNDGWIEWGGGSCPVGGEEIVDVNFRGGGGSRSWHAGTFDWTHIGAALDIIAYRVIENDGREG